MSASAAQLCKSFPVSAEFARYHRDNPFVYEKLVELARLVKSKGKRCSIQFLIERVRWFYMVETTGEAAIDFKINNNFASRYARLIMENEPDLRGLFELREIRTA